MGIVLFEICRDANCLRLLHCALPRIEIWTLIMPQRLHLTQFLENGICQDRLETLGGLQTMRLSSISLRQSV
jgi:hypothetical protein